MGVLDNLLQFVLPKGNPKKGGTTSSATFNPSQAENVLTVPTYQDHLTDIFSSRQADNSRDLLKSLFVHDPDISAAVHAYLTLSNTDPVVIARTIDGQIDPDATKQLHQILVKLAIQTDYTLKFQLKQSLRQILAEYRYMLLLRGAIGVELIVDKQLTPDSLRQVDMATIKWYEKQSGQYKPVQLVPGSSDEVSLDFPTFFVAFYRRDPTAIYANSAFVAAINTIAARQQVINDLYRIMQITGYPRMEITIMEEVLIKNAPANVKADQNALKSWVNTRMGELSASFANIRADQAVTHTDAVELGMLNDKKPGASIDISAVVDTLNAQNQAALKVMSTVIGRGENGANTGSVEARIAAMFADELNEPLSDLLARVLTFLLNQNGFQGYAEVRFRKAELRPETELEPQLTLKAARLRQDLSDGIITDEEYTLEMYGRLPNDGAPPLSGTGFMTPVPAGDTGAADVSTTNGGPLSKSLAPTGSKTASKMTKSAKKGQKNSQNFSEILTELLLEQQ
jgi:hypothetical protein